MAEPKRRYRWAWLVLLSAAAVTLLLWLKATSETPGQDKALPAETQAARLPKPADDNAHAIAAADVINESNDVGIDDAGKRTAAVDCSGDFEALIGQYRPELAQRLKRLDAQRRFIESTGPFNDAFGELGKLSYPGYESYDTDTLLRLGNNGDQVANVLYSAHQLERDLSQTESNSNGFNAVQFEQSFQRLQQALEAGQTGALYLTQYVLKLRALLSSKQVQHNMPLSNRAAVVEAQAWQLATARVGTLAERVIAQHFGDALDKGSFQLMNDQERQQLKQRSEELLRGTLRNLQHPISDDEQQAEAALRELFALIEDPALASLNCRDGRSLHKAISETFIDD
ncbi:hypothetical protein HPT27_02170 [Permianibacter sp. IMCC34836]|uniref:hypothetical protein n=1 Tax=Permianibacter fluminis TaxID=2738515 RepID=UPI0015569EAB|nr:hypothetical protein [Permianibacter fluminis]NQD35809.1 hypothetical protein [Permianibacter fluminis]